jgi:hypothetical protein
MQKRFSRVVVAFAIASVIGTVLTVPSVHANGVPATLGDILSAVLQVQGKTNALPGDPASTSDVNAARDQIVGALPTNGFLRRTTVAGNQCLPIAGPVAAGRAQSITVSIVTTNINAQAFVQVANPVSNLFGYVISIPVGLVQTFVESVTGGEQLQVCNQTGGSAMVITATWTEFAE